MYWVDIFDYTVDPIPIPRRNTTTTVSIIFTYYILTSSIQIFCKDIEFYITKMLLSAKSSICWYDVAEGSDMLYISGLFD